MSTSTHAHRTVLDAAQLANYFETVEEITQIESETFMTKQGEQTRLMLDLSTAFVPASIHRALGEHAAITNAWSSGGALSIEITVRAPLRYGGERKLRTQRTSIVLTVAPDAVDRAGFSVDDPITQMARTGEIHLYSE